MEPRFVEMNRDDGVRATDVGICDGVEMKCVLGGRTCEPMKWCIRPCASA